MLGTSAYWAMLTVLLVAKPIHMPDLYTLRVSVYTDAPVAAVELTYQRPDSLVGVGETLRAPTTRTLRTVDIAATLVRIDSAGDVRVTVERFLGPIRMELAEGRGAVVRFVSSVNGLLVSAEPRRF